ncbi:MAG: ATP-dependent helicase [Armatimonadetes bacterium]|nr:MAG: ATP-dependent helicase [Armatimonadota bacterium]
METIDVAETRIDPSEWDAHIAPPGYAQMVVGGPGTGKTEFLCRRVVAAINDGCDPASIAVLTFSRRSVNDVRTRLFSAIGSASYRVQVATYHSLANRLVEAHHAALGWAAAPTVLAGPEHERFVLSILEQEDPNNWRAPYRPIVKTPAMASEVTDFILRFHEQTMTIADLERSSVPEWEGLAGFLRRYDEELTATGRIDYGRLLNEAVLVLETNPGIVASYSHVFADEYQDTSHAQARLLFGLAQHSKSLTVAGDPYQSIYSFRGTDLDNVLNFPTHAASQLGTKADRLVLTTSFRVPEQILEAAVNVTGRALPGAAGKVKSIRTRGSVATHVFDNPDAESEWIASDIERLHLVDGIALSRIAVFTRSGGSFHHRVAASLDRRSLPHTLTLEQLEDQPVVRFVHDLVAVAGSDESIVDRPDVTDTMRSILLGPFMAAAPATVNAVVRRVNDGAEWSTEIAERIPHGRAIASLLNDHAWATEMPAEQGLWHLWKSLPPLHGIAVDDDRIPDRRAWSAFAQSVTRFGSRAPHATLRDQQILSATSDIEADPLFSFRAGPAAGVAIATLHAAKGTEYDAVYIAHAVEGLLPDLRTKDSLLKTRLLNPQLPEDPSAYVQFRLSEERRLAYTAMTRATDRVVWTATVVDNPSEQIEPSRFLRQIGEPIRPVGVDRPLTRRGYEAALRRTMHDPLALDVERLAAMIILAEGPDHGFDSPTDRYGVAVEGTDQGFVPSDHRLSPSQANTYDQCPRRFAFDRFATRLQTSTFNMELGTLIHKVLELAEAETIESGRERSTLARALEILESLWDEYDFGSAPVASSWHRRAVSILEHQYQKWPASGPPVRAEVSLSLQLDGTNWKGTVDRIERIGDALKIVDYKTSKSVPTVAEAAASLQLGFYVLATAADPELATIGTVRGAEFWFPAPEPSKDAIKTRSFDMTNLDAVRERLETIAHAVHDEDFPATPNSDCHRCDFLSVCPAQKEGREAFAR